MRICASTHLLKSVLSCKTSRVLRSLTLYSECTRALTFENVLQYALAELGLVLQDLCRLQAFSMEACSLTGRSVQKMMTLFACSTSLQSLSLAHNEGLGQDGILV